MNKNWDILNPLPPSYDSLNRKSEIFRLLIAVNGVQIIFKPNCFCLAVFDWPNFWHSGSKYAKNLVKIIIITRFILNNGVDSMYLAIMGWWEGAKNILCVQNKAIN